MSYFSYGKGTHKVPYSMHQRLRNKVLNRFKSDVGIKASYDSSFLLLKGGGEISLYDSDTVFDFRQESNFQYFFGAFQPGLWGGVDLDTGKSYLFVPRLDEIYATWLGPIKDAGDFKKYYEVDEVLYLESLELATFLKQYQNIVTPLGLNLDSGIPSWSAEQILGKEGTKELLAFVENNCVKSNAPGATAVGNGVIANTNGNSRSPEEDLKAEFASSSSSQFSGLCPDLLPSAEESKDFLKSKFRTDLSAIVWHSINECRAVKDVEELKVLQYVCDVSSEAHIVVMKKVYEHYVSTKVGETVAITTDGGSPISSLKDHKFKPNVDSQFMFKNPHHRASGVSGDMREFLSEAEFRYQSFLRGCARTAYGCICPSGGRAAILHYGHSGEPNLELVEDGQMKLHDMGAEYHCYASDVTCTFPVNGKFNEQQARVYNAVWVTTELVEKNLKPGVRYGDMHQLAQKSLLRELQGFIFSKEFTVEEMFNVGVVGNFMPHGLGHMYGLAVHDVAGYVQGESRKTYPEIKENLRLNRELQENFTLTVEPGFYFIPHCIKKVYRDPELKKYMIPSIDEIMLLCNVVGGVRIEDDVVITKTGCRVLNNVPREIEDIQNVMTGYDEWGPERCHRQYDATLG